MIGYRLTRKAADDLISIYNYTFHQHGELQADTYLHGIEEKLNELANSPSIAVNADGIRPGYKRVLFQKHVIYFKEERDGILIVRILHQQMKATLHFD